MAAAMAIAAGMGTAVVDTATAGVDTADAALSVAGRVDSAAALAGAVGLPAGMRAALAAATVAAVTDKQLHTQLFQQAPWLQQPWSLFVFWRARRIGVLF
jgi:hypothetical protein